LGKINQNLTLSNYDPYFTDDGISRYTDLYYRSSKPLYYVGDPDYQIKSVGSNIKFGVPYTEVDRVFFGTGVEAFQIQTTSNTPIPYLNYAQSYGIAAPGYPGTLTTYNVPLTVGWARDGRDSLIYPTKGTFQRASVEVGVPGLGTLEYYKTGYQYQRYFPLTRIYTLMLNGEAGVGDGLNDLPLPFFKNYFAGGVSSVRGYRTSSLGPKDVDGNPQGGSHKLVGNAEFLFPFPGLMNDRSVRLGAFFDAGMIANSIDMNEFRYSTGMSLFWSSPMGPLKISVAAPINSQPGDRKQAFQFSFGGTF
jgi:outer membrane protein insertion porin family